MTEKQGKRILYIEDDLGLARLFKRGLQREGYQVDHAGDGGEGLRLIDEQDYDLIAVDQHLPVYNGLEVIERLMGREDTPPIIMVTGTGDEKTAVSALKLGARDYIVKDVEGGYLDLLPSVIEQTFANCKLEADKARAESALVANEARYRNLVELSPDAVLVVSEGRVAFANAAALRLTGFDTKEDIVSLSLSHLFHVEDLVDLKTRIAEITQKGCSKNMALEARLARDDQPEVTVEILAAQINFAGASACQLVMRDITHLRAAAQEIQQRNEELEQIIRDTTAQLEEANREMGFGSDPDTNQKATDVLHNVKNVLTSLIVSTNMMKKVVGSSRVEKLGRVAEMMKQQGDQVGAFIAKDPKGRLIPEFLTGLSTVLQREQKMMMDEIFSLAQNLEHINVSIQLQQSSARMHQAREEIGVEEIYGEACRVNDVDIKRYGVYVQHDYPQLPKVPAFKHMLLQILVNLISNAVQAMSGNPRERRGLVLRAHLGEDQMMHFAVVDQGMGIPPERMAKLFAYGYTTRKTGHGFGLHSCRHLAEKMDGALNAHSEGEGKGSTFVLSLPMDLPAGI